MPSYLNNAIAPKDSGGAIFYLGLLASSNSRYETNFGVSNAEGAGNTKISFLKASLI